MCADINILVYSLICGAFIGTVYEVFRILRLTFIKLPPEKTNTQMIRLPKTADETNIVLKEMRVSELCAGRIMTAVSDVIFFLLCGIIVSVLIFHTNEGEIRWFSLAGCALGFAVYMLTLGKILPKVYVKIEDTVARILLKMIKILFSPVVKIAGKASARITLRQKRKKAKRMVYYITRKIKKDKKRQESRAENSETDTDA